MLMASATSKVTVLKWLGSVAEFFFIRKRIQIWGIWTVVSLKVFRLETKSDFWSTWPIWIVVLGLTEQSLRWVKWVAASLRVEKVSINVSIQFGTLTNKANKVISSSESLYLSERRTDWVCVCVCVHASKCVCSRTAADSWCFTGCNALSLNWQQHKY